MQYLRVAATGPEGRSLIWLTVTALVCTAAILPAAATTANSVQFAVSKNIPGSLGHLCSSQTGLVTLIQQGSDFRDADGSNFNVMLPADLNNPLAIQQTAQIAWEYIYSYPLPILAKTLAVDTANGSDTNTFSAHIDHLATSNDTGVVLPNHDTVYGAAFLDLNQGAQKLTVPAFDAGRYWQVQFLDAFTNVNAALGSHYNSTPGDYLIVGPGASVGNTDGFPSERIIHAATDIVWVLDRVLVFNDRDTPTAAALLNNITVGPVSGERSRVAVKAAAIAAAVNTAGLAAAGAQDQVQFLEQLSQNPVAWFSFAATYVTLDPPGNGTGPLDTALADLSRAAKNATGLALQAFQLGQQIANGCITSAQVGLVTPNGWSYRGPGPTYGTDYLQRAQVARDSLGQQEPTEAIYMFATKDSKNRTLDSSTGNNYTLTLPLPLPASAFWSLTMYNATNFLFIDNPINRYNIGDHTAGLAYSGANNDTLQVFISAQQPPAGPQLANWLPAPPDVPFLLVIRLYVPENSVLNGEYQPPPVIRG